MELAILLKLPTHGWIEQLTNNIINYFVWTQPDENGDNLSMLRLPLKPTKPFIYLSLRKVLIDIEVQVLTATQLSTKAKSHFQTEDKGRVRA